MPRQQLPLEAEPDWVRVRADAPFVGKMKIGLCCVPAALRLP